MSEKVQTIHTRFGEVRLVRKENVKRLTIKVKPFSGVEVSVPFYLTFRQAEDFVNERKDWIGRQLNRMRQVEKALTVFTAGTLYNTRRHNLKIMKSSGNTAMYSISTGEVKVFYPAGDNITDERTQRLIRTALEVTWKLEASEYLPGRISELAKKHGFKYNRVFIRNNKSRWGSCSVRNNINLNLHLMRLPDELIDYVLVHELVHTRYRNHSSQFWASLENCIPGARERNRQLKNFRTDIY